MLHLFFQPGDWFAPKRYGFGAGRPIAWQGWALTLSYVGAICGLALTMPPQGGGSGPMAARGMGFVVLTGMFLLIVARRTRGGFRWRWGGRG